MADEHPDLDTGDLGNPNSMGDGGGPIEPALQSTLAAATAQLTTAIEGVDSARADAAAHVDAMGAWLSLGQQLLDKGLPAIQELVRQHQAAVVQGGGHASASPLGGFISKLTGTISGVNGAVSGFQQLAATLGIPFGPFGARSV